VLERRGTGNSSWLTGAALVMHDEMSGAPTFKRGAWSFLGVVPLSLMVLACNAGCCWHGENHKRVQAASAIDDPALQRLADYQRKFASMRGSNIFSGHDVKDIVESVSKARLQLADDLTEGELAELRRSVTKDLLSNLPTEFENPLTFAGIRQSVRRVEGGARVLNLQLHPPPVFGTLPLPTLNAEALPRRRGDAHDVIVVNDALSFFCTTAAHVAAWGLPERDSDLPLDVDPPVWATQRLKQIPEIAHQMALLVYGFVTQGQAYPRAMPQAHAQILFGHLAGEGMRDFVVAHELSHGYLGHTSSNIFTVRLEHSDDGPLSIDFVGLNWQQELDADHMAVRLLDAVTRATNADFQVRLSRGAYKFSVLLYHRLSGIIDEAEFIKKKHELPAPLSLDMHEEVDRHLGTDVAPPLPFSSVDPLYIGTVSHPPSWARFDRANQQCVDMLDEIPESQASQLRDLQKILIMDACLSVSWHVVKPLLLEWLNKE
jgi:hypothetical protein